MTPDDERPDELEWRLHAMFDQRAATVESGLSGPALRARAARRPTARKYVAPLAAAAAVAGLAIGIAVAVGSDGGGHPEPAGGSVSRPAVTSAPSPRGPASTTGHPTRAARTPVLGPDGTPDLSPSLRPAPGHLGSPSVSTPGGRLPSQVQPGSSSGAPRIPSRSTQVPRADPSRTS